MAMNDGWSRPAGVFEQILSTRDCDPAIGELVLRGAVKWMFVPAGSGDRPFAYSANLELVHDGGRRVVRVVKAAVGQETRLVEGWSEICEDLDLMPGDTAVFTRTGGDTFFAQFLDPDGNDRLSRFGAADPPSSPEFQGLPPSSPEFQGLPPSSPEFQVNSDWLRALHADSWPAQGAEWGRAEHAAGAAAVDGAMQGGDLTIREAMDLAVQCGAREGSDEHYMATKLFVKAENRAMFLTFRTNAGRLQWLRRCYQDWMN